MENDISPGSTQISVVPFLLGGMATILVFIVIALLVISCSDFLKERAMGGEANSRSDQHYNVELGARGKNEMSEDMSNVSDDNDDLTVIVIMPGDKKPTFVAKPTSVAAALN